MPMKVVVCCGAMLLAAGFRSPSRAGSSGQGRGHTASASGVLGAAERDRAAAASGVAGAELYLEADYKYGRFEASTLFAGADGVISSFFLMGKEAHLNETYWNELDFEKIGLAPDGECKLGLNMISGWGLGPNHDDRNIGSFRGCREFHDYTFEWTPDYVKWIVDGAVIHSLTGATLNEFNANVGPGMQFRFNVWPGDHRFGGNFNSNSLPLYQYLDWVRYSSYSGPGDFTVEWQEDFTGESLPTDRDWKLASWGSPLGHSEHRPANAVFTGGMAVLALTSSTEVPTSDSVPPPPSPSPPPSPTPSTAPPSAGGRCCYGPGCSGCNGEGEWCSSSVSACEGSCGGTFCSR